MATRHADVRFPSDSTPQKVAPEKQKVATPSAAPAGSTADSSADPSPFSRPSSAQTMAREEQIAIAAYDRAARRGFEPGHELEDWLAAEREVDARNA
jgi:hypothetical protein